MESDKTVVKDKKEELNLPPEDLSLINEMIEAGIIHGRKHSKLNPKMARYIVGMRKGVDVIDILQTKELLDKAAVFIKSVQEKGLPILVVGIKPPVKDLVENFAQKMGFAYATERWLGGTLTNFKVIFKRVEHWKKLRADMKEGQLDKYTKKERLFIQRELDKMDAVFRGIENLNQLPGAVIIIDTADHAIVVREADRLHIPIVGLINTDGDPEAIDYPIPCNDNARSSVQWVLNKLEEKLR